MSDTFAWYVGIDWGSEEHHLCLLNAAGQVRGTRAVAQTADAVHEALRWVCACTGAAPDAVAVGLETPRGALVDTVIEQGFAVFALNPKQLDRFRDRFTAGGAKDDRRDAPVVADALRTDRRAFRAVRPDAPPVIQLRELSRLVEELHVEEGRLANRLREQLDRVDAAWLTLSPAADEPWLWTVLAGAPHPDAWRQLPRRRVTPALRALRIRRLTADAISTALRSPRLTVAAGVADAVAIRIAALVPQLILVHQQRTTSERQIDRLLETLATADAAAGEPHEHRDVEILRSLPGVGRMVTATMLAEALYHWARTSIQHDAGARAYYDGLRARGHRHARALRSVADRWLRILVAMLTTRTLYDPSRLRHVAPVAA